MRKLIKTVCHTILRLSLIGFSLPLLATIEGYNDIYLDRESKINVHSIFCAPNLDNLNALKNSYIYTNTEHIEQGTYYFSSAYGNFTYTFKAIEGQNPQQLLFRGLLTNDNTNKDNMVKEVCIVGPMQGLPPKLIKNLSKFTISPQDPEWDATMKQLAMFGKPAFAEGVYVDPRTTAQHDSKNKAVYNANQVYLTTAITLFEAKFSEISTTLPQKLKAAIEYANQQDGFLVTKTYPVIQEPTVWTPIAKERYDDQQSQLAQERAWDFIIQENFDWFFNLTTRGNTLQSVQLSGISELAVRDQVIEQTSTVSATFANGKKLYLDFLIKSKPLPKTIFYSLAEIEQEANAIRGSAIASSRKTRTPIQPPTTLDVYSNVEKTVIFFSPFREKTMGDGYSYQ
ncbi:hypothetical protein [Colwellia echini]|uniref:Uncharacterized protein n=1 Tax=Colwellia echini TaxID=1982103 RepID=A0ABY3N1Z2_9GAMM|nr:hypothetical protein [Colwellia echini]TYK67252.1 hypothetical protein CWS31_001635 [Colwellia echini]